MQKVNTELDSLDLRSLRLLKSILELRSVTKAGETLTLSQPAASRVLAQLRRALGDPLLVRGRHGNFIDTQRRRTSATGDRSLEGCLSFV